MSNPVLLTKTSLESAITATAASIATALDGSGVPGQNLYELTSDTNCWVAQGIADTVFTALASSDVCTVAGGHGMNPGDAFMVSNSGGGLPAGLSAATVYWANVLTSTTFKVYDTRAHALAGTATGLIDITTNGTGTQTATTTASAAAGSAYVPANTARLIDGINGAKVSVVRDTADGKASITQIMMVR
jgi:hypothetical protein